MKIDYIMKHKSIIVIYTRFAR